MVADRSYVFRCLTILILSLSIFLVFSFAFFSPRTVGNPSNPGDCSCHSIGAYKISTHTSNNFQIQPRSNFSIDITALGPGVIVQFHPDARDNSKFDVYPNDTVMDNTLFDENASVDGVYVNFSFTAPLEEAEYKILIFARSPTGPQPDLVCIEFDVIVGGTNFFLEFFNHWNIYLGLIAILCLVLSTVIYERNHQLIKAHGILASIALILTTINIVQIIPQTIEVFNSWETPNQIDWWHLSHVLVAIVGYGAAIIALIAGLSGIRQKWSGYLALICWGYCFIHGIIAWGLNF